MRLLLVSYAFPPQRNAESMLVLATVRALTQAGWEITVLTIDHTRTTEPVDLDLLQDVPPGVAVIRAGGWEHVGARYRGPWRAFWYGLRMLGLPERHCAWYFPALRAAHSLLKTQHFDAMHSWANYHVSNIVALQLHRAYRLPWVAHFSDPWTDSHYFRSRSTPLQRLTCARLERRIIEEAGAVVFVTDETARLVMRKYPEALQAKVRIVPHGYDPAVLAGLPPETRSDNGGRPLRLVHVGAFYPGLREPISLLRALASVHQEHALDGRLHLRLVGPYTEHYRELTRQLGLEKIVELQPAVGRQASMLEARRADVLLIIDAPSSGSEGGESVFMPSKLVDYLMLRKPILGVTPARGATARVLGELGFPIAEPTDTAGIANAVRQLLRAHAAHELALPVGFDRVAEQYHIARTTAALSAVLDEVSAAR
jgi:glycosyltransferase involved in cell wall biosynthesis